MEIKSKLKCCVVHQDHKTALENSFIAAILTEWDEFKSYDWDAITHKMKHPAKVFDGRNILNNTMNYRIGKP